MFTKGFQKTAVSLGKWVKGMHNREQRLGKVIDKLTKGNKTKMKTFLGSVRDSKKLVDVPLSADVISEAKNTGFGPKDMANRFKHSRSGRMMDHADKVKRTTEELPKMVKKEVGTMARRKKHYASDWKNISASLSKARKTKKKAK